MPADLPQFAVWQWLQHLERLGHQTIQNTHKQALALCASRSRAPNTDTTAKRMMENYAAILTAWELLKQFSGMADNPNAENNDPGHFTDDRIGEMNEHIADTDGIRLPWVWIMEILLSEIDAGRFEHPYTWDTYKHPDGRTETALYLRPGHVMDHVSTAPHLRAKFDSLPIKTSKVFKQQLMASGGSWLTKWNARYAANVRRIWLPSGWRSWSGWGCMRHRRLVDTRRMHKWQQEKSVETQKVANLFL